jgi:hypothetical protein
MADGVTFLSHFSVSLLLAPERDGYFVFIFVCFFSHPAVFLFAHNTFFLLSHSSGFDGLFFLQDACTFHLTAFLCCHLSSWRQLVPLKHWYLPRILHDVRNSSIWLYIHIQKLLC